MKNAVCIFVFSLYLNLSFQRRLFAQFAAVVISGFREKECVCVLECPGTMVRAHVAVVICCSVKRQ